MTPMLPVWSEWLLAGFSLVILSYAAWTSPWRALGENRIVQHLFFGSAIVVSLFWSMKAGILDGLSFHVLGLTAVTLMMGWRLALVAAALVQLLLLVFGRIEWPMLGYHYLIECALPIGFTFGFYLLVYRRLVHNPFVYILVAGFLNAGFTHAFSDLLQGAVWLVFDIHELKDIWHNYWRYLPLMMFPEGVINGMFISGMVAFHTRWLSTFDEESYFN
ncbi:MAG: energy-coupling factor ABC transporter permease [Oceanobacter sp.]